MSYIIYKSDGSIFLTLADGQIDTANTSLTLVGKRVVNYGQYENSNLVKLLENFASQTAPPNAVAGQIWFDKTSSVLRLKVYNGTAWKSIPNLSISTSTPTLNYGDLWLDSDDDTLYMKATTTIIPIAGPNFNAPTATRLQTPRTINNVLFSGTASITISATLTNGLIFGSYLTGVSFNGSVSTTTNVDVGVVTQPTPSKIVARDNNGDIYFRVGYGTATSSRYADLAEKYLADSEYDVGTVVAIGGSKEVTACNIGDRPIGVVSENPGFMMNQDLENGTYIALKGRVPVKVLGTIKKGQRLVAAENGHARAVAESHLNVFAIAIEDNNGKNIIEALIL